MCKSEFAANQNLLMRIVIKVGTNVLRAGTERLHRPRLIDIARQIASLSSNGHEPILVSSGAIFAGRELLGLDTPAQKKDIPHKQMLAAVGQGRLLTLYQRIFEMYDITVAQALLTRADLVNRTRYLNARNTLQLLNQQKVLPIINENDVVAVDEDGGRLSDVQVEPVLGDPTDDVLAPLVREVAEVDLKDQAYVVL